VLCFCLALPHVVFKCLLSNIYWLDEQKVTFLIDICLYDILNICDNVASSLRRAGGHFVCKLFDVFTRFSVGLVYLMHRAFEHVALFKPVTSRPANSERFAYYSMSLHFSLLVEALTLFYD